MKRVLIFGLFLIQVAAFAQDNMIFKSGEEIKVSVLEVNPAEVKYKRFDNPGGPTYTVLKNDLFMIKYQNGTKETFNTTGEKAIITDTVGRKPVVTKKFEFGLNAGLSVPSGNFNNPGLYPYGYYGQSFPFYGNTSTGFALTGDLLYRINSYFGIGFSASFYSNEVNKEAMNQLYTGNNLQGGNITFDYTRWTTYAFMGGVTATYPAAENIFFNASLKAGVCHGISPELKMNYSVNSYNYGYGGSNVKVDYSILVNSASNTSFGISLESDFQYNVSQRFAIKFGMEYITANHSYQQPAKLTYTTTENNNVTTVMEDSDVLSYSQVTNMIKPFVGTVVRF